MSPKQKRTEIKRLLGLLDEGCRHTFNRMYSHTDLTRDVNLVVDELPSKKVSWALQQCQNSYYGLFNKIKNSSRQA